MPDLLSGNVMKGERKKAIETAKESLRIGLSGEEIKNLKNG
ncbi:MAG: hypothetical protein ABRQ37_14910 [Candidatus Eremiobacterota bacterium]